MSTQDPEKQPQKQKARYIDPPNILRQKVGAGGIDPLRLTRGEEYIDNNDMDFTPYAQEIMQRLNDIMAEAKAGKIKGKSAVDLLTRPIMELKANGGMFRYMLVSEIADIVLNFLESIDKLDADAFDILDAHQNTLHVIISNKLQGGGGKEGRALALELYEACKRYFKKHNVKL